MTDRSSASASWLHGFSARLPRGAQERVSRLLAERFGRTLLVSTLHGGGRSDGLTRAERDDLLALADALPEGRLGLDAPARDAASGEPAMLTAIRVAEGLPPALPAVLLPRDVEEAESLLSEAFAAGYAPGGGPRRPIGLSFARAQAASVTGREVRFEAGMGWDALAALAAGEGLGLPVRALCGLFPTPADAAEAGLLGEASVTRIVGVIAEAHAGLPPAAVGATDRTWLLPSAGAAEVFRAVNDLFEPLLTETLPPLDVAVLAAAGLGSPPRADEAGLRVVLKGTPRVRAAAARELSARLRRAGGRSWRRGPIAGSQALTGLAAICGAARLSTGADAAPPEGAVRTARFRSVLGRTSENEIVWYPRELGRSLEQAVDVLSPEPSAPASPNDDDSWDALRAALAEAMP